MKIPVATSGIGYPGSNAHAPDENIRIDLYLKGAKHIARIIQEFEGFADTQQLPSVISQKVSIALDELLNNIISYGFDDDEDHGINIQFDYADQRLEVSVVDDGKPFNPFDQRMPDTSLTVEKRSIGGLGVLLVKELMNEVSYQRVQGSNIVKLVLNTVL